MYLSHEARGPGGIVANSETFPSQLIVSMFCVEYSVMSRSVPAAATPMGPLPPEGSKTGLTGAKEVGMAYKTPASATKPAIVTVIFVLRVIFFIFCILGFG